MICIISPLKKGDIVNMSLRIEFLQKSCLIAEPFDMLPDADCCLNDLR